MTASQRAFSAALFLAAAMLGLVALLYPFAAVWLQTEAGIDPLLQGGQTPALTMILVTLCLAVLLADAQGEQTGSKVVATLGILVAIAAALRFVEVGIPGPGGFSPIFVPIIIGGYVFGARFGFLLGVLSMLVSGIITGGIGPWLPYQMFCAGWVGLTAGWLPHVKSTPVELMILVGFGAIWGFLYGAAMNLFTWPFLAGDAFLNWQPEAGITAALGSYGAYYVATSLIWDFGRVLGNVTLLAFVGLPAVRALERLRDKLSFVLISS